MGSILAGGTNNTLGDVFNEYFAKIRVKRGINIEYSLKAQNNKKLEAYVRHMLLLKHIAVLKSVFGSV